MKDYLIKVRESKSYTQAHMAQLLDCHYSKISRIESGEKILEWDVAVAWLNACDVKVTLNHKLKEFRKTL